MEGSLDELVGSGGRGVGYFYPLLAESPSVGAPPFPWVGSQQWEVVGEAGWADAAVRSHRPPDHHQHHHHYSQVGLARFH